MARQRKVRQWGNSAVIVLMKADLKDMHINIGDMVDIEDLIILKSTKR
jgi:antitoxin component of MazEF toxin-antitoxin module